MIRLFISILSVCVLLSAEEASLERKIGQMLMVGFYGTHAHTKSQICQDIARYNLGGVILFDYNPVDKTKPKNIASKEQLRRLTQELQACSSDGKLLIAVDQEGGRVQRLKRTYGFFGMFPQASEVAKMDKDGVRQMYVRMSEELQDVGINYDLAPVVDLDINAKNQVIHGLGRSYNKDPKVVAEYAQIFIKAMHQNGVLTSIKHFPGHGSSVGDTHKGFVDVTKLYQQKEMQVYGLLKNEADTVMVAHVFNRHFDAAYPASLSQKTISGVLRQRLGYEGVVITDDLQMGAISHKYGFHNALKLAINAGDDILLVGNQLDPRQIQPIKTLVDTIVSLVQSGEVEMNRIDEANRRIEKLKQKL